MTAITYGRLDEILRSFGYVPRTNDAAQPPARVYKHEAPGANFILPVLPDDMAVQAWHLAGARLKIDLCGIATPAEFDRRAQVAG